MPKKPKTKLRGDGCFLLFLKGSPCKVVNVKQNNLEVSLTTSLFLTSTDREGNAGFVGKCKSYSKRMGGGVSQENEATKYTPPYS